jgi:N-terminal domain of anti-restriction factor ArdC
MSVPALGPSLLLLLRKRLHLDLPCSVHFRPPVGQMNNELLAGTGCNSKRMKHMTTDQAKTHTENALLELSETLSAGRSERLISYLRCMGQFYHYSFRNLLLISSQSPNATQIAGFHAWRKLNRSVRKGEKGIAILAPLACKKRKDDGCEKDSDEPAALFGFRVVHVFDISQTDGQELSRLATASGDPGQMLTKLEALIERSGIRLTYDELRPGLEGYSAGGRIAINRELDAANRFSVMAHELAHEWLDHRTQETSLTIKETEAEAVAFVVCSAHGIECHQSSTDYIQLYRGDSATLMTSLNVIQTVAVRILNGLSA